MNLTRDIITTRLKQNGSVLVLIDCRWYSINSEEYLCSHEFVCNDEYGEEYVFSYLDVSKIE